MKGWNGQNLVFKALVLLGNWFLAGQPILRTRNSRLVAEWYERLRNGQHSLVVMSRKQTVIIRQCEYLLVDWCIECTWASFLEIGSSATPNQYCVSGECDTLKSSGKLKELKTRSLFHQIWFKANIFSVLMVGICSFASS